MPPGSRMAGPHVRHQMRLSPCIALFGLLAPTIGLASVTAVWSPTDASAATAWWNEIGGSANHKDPYSFCYFSTDADFLLSNPIVANLTVWSDRAELNVLGIGALPTNLQLWVSFLGIGTILEIPQSQLALANSEGGLSCFSYTSNFRVEDGFSRITFNSAISNGLLLIVDSGNPPSDTYTFQLATIPEPGVAELLGLGSVFLLHRRRNRRGEQGADGKPPEAAQPPHQLNPNARLP